LNQDIQLIPYYHASSVSVIPSYGNDDARILTDGTLAITGNSLDMAALNGYMYIIKVLKCRALFTSERYSASLDERWLPEA
jgi:hypothetical protein